MKIEIKVPAMGESISEVTIGTILKPSGSSVSQEDELLELETDKVNQVLYAPEGGVVTLTVSTDDTVKIGQVIGSIDTTAKAKEEPNVSEKKVVKEEVKPKKTAEKPSVSKAPPAEEILKPSLKKTDEPAVRFGKEEFISELKAPVSPQPATASVKPSTPSSERKETRQRMSKIRRVIADRLVTAQQTTAMLTTFNEIDLSEVIALREKYKDSFQKKYGVKLGFMSFFVKAAVSALKEIPSINSYIDGEEIVHREYYDLGIAVGTEKGLVVPVVRNCDLLSISEIESEIERYAKKARDGTIAVNDLQGGSFTITNGGTYGSLLSTPILNPPQCGILGMHKILKRPVVVDDQIVIRPMMYVALSYDHRIVDGKEAVTFLVHIKNVLEDPARFFLGI